MSLKLDIPSQVMGSESLAAHLREKRKAIFSLAFCQILTHHITLI